MGHEVRCVRTVAVEVYTANAEKYRRDKSHPCVLFALQVLAEGHPRMANRAKQAESIQWGQHKGVGEGDREGILRHYQALWGFTHVDEPREWDVAMIAFGRRIGHIGIYTCPTEVVHLDIRTHLLEFTPVQDLRIIDSVRC